MVSIDSYCEVCYPFNMLGVPTPLKQRNPKNKYNVKINPDIKKAKEFSIEDIYKGTLKISNKVKMGCCPFHEETTPSFAIYPETNTWYCFAGCGGGDVISFYMKLNNCTFNTALEELTN